jgi:methyl-accepting chemotaxis protein
MKKRILGSIGGKIILLVLTLLMVGTSLPVALSYFNARKALLETTIESVTEITDLTGNHLEFWIDSRIQDVESLGKAKIFQVALKDGFIGRSARKSAGDQLRSTLEENPYYIALGLSDRNGTIVASSDEQSVDRSIKGEPFITTALNKQTELSSLHLNEATRSTAFVISTPIIEDGSIVGVLFARINLGHYIKEFIQSLKIGDTGYFYLLDANGITIAHPDTTHIMQTDITQFDFGREIVSKQNGVVYYDWENRERLAVVKTLPTLGWIIVGSGHIDELTQRIGDTTFFNLVLSLFILLTAAILAYFASRRISRPIVDAVRIIQKIAKGDYSVRLAVSSRDEIKQLAEATNELAVDLQHAVSDINQVMGAVAEGNLTRQVEVALKGELSKLKDRINESVIMLGDTIAQAAIVNEQVNAGARDLSNSAQTLADGTSRQAASLEEIASTLNEVDAQSRSNNDNATQARQLSAQAADIVQRGDTQMQSMLKAMKEIETQSNQISKIIKVIDEIAFQTNLLALNAAVEAARAGKYGKGFAVVAEEVRNLAARSAEAAKNTTEMIENARKEVRNGVDNADKTATILTEIKRAMIRLNDIVGEINEASKEQTQGIEEINKGLTQVNDVVQQNSSISEETASAADELSAQAERMSTLMQKFQTRQQPATPSPSTSTEKRSDISQLPYQKPPARFITDKSPPPPQKRPTAETSGGTRTTILLDDVEFGKY